MRNEEKPALIEHIQTQLDLLRNVTMRYADECEIVGIEQDIKVQEIALAALAAQPVKLPDLSNLDSLAGQFLQNAISTNGKVSAAYTQCAHLLATEVRAIRAAGYEVQE